MRVSTQVLKFLGGPKSKIFNPLSLCGLKDWPKWEDSNLVSKVKSHKNLSPLWSKNVENWQSTYLSESANFWQCLGHKGGQMLFNLNFEARSGILWSFSISYNLIYYYFHILFFGLSCYLTINAGRGPQFLLRKCKFRLAHLDIDLDIDRYS